MKETDTQVPYRHGPYLYYSRDVKGLPYKIHCRTKEEGGEEQVRGAAAAAAAAAGLIDRVGFWVRFCFCWRNSNVGTRFSAQGYSSRARALGFKSLGKIGVVGTRQTRFCVSRAS